MRRALAIIISILGNLLYLVLLTINRTLKITINNELNLSLFAQTPYIFTIWHQNTFAPFFIYRHKNIAMFVSKDWKGKVLGICANKLGYDTIPLEHDHAKGTVRILHKIKEGHNIIMAVDGPQGPPKIIKEGSHYLTEKTEVPAIAVKVEYSAFISLFWRWDKYRIPLPFSKIKITFSKPFISKSDWESLSQCL